MRRRRCDRDDGRAWIIGCEVSGCEVELALRIWTATVPQTDGVVETGGEEVIGARRERKGGHAIFVALEVANEAVVVHAQVSNAMVNFGRGVDDVGGVVSEAGQGVSVFLRLQLFRMRAGLSVVELNRVIGAGEEGELAAVVEVDGGVGGGRFELFGWAEGLDDILDLGQRSAVGRGTGVHIHSIVGCRVCVLERVRGLTT